MVKGVNRQVVEVSQTQSEYFERILFFVKPEYAAMSEGKLRDRAGMIAGEGAKVVPTRIKGQRATHIISLVLACLTGFALGVILSNIF